MGVPHKDSVEKIKLIAGITYNIIYPSLILVVLTVLIICATDETKETNIAKLVLWFDRIQLCFYLWHSLVLARFAERISLGNVWAEHVMLLICGYFVVYAVTWYMTNANSVPDNIIQRATNGYKLKKSR